MKSESCRNLSSMYSRCGQNGNIIKTEMLEDDGLQIVLCFLPTLALLTFFN